ncbi:MAG: Vms1/Ankzf1 family peptidyl-tRNA hydrolase [Chloroflexota bacterium]|nr:Vms1/Ankzf1 family peptidyl-tRNA hydrolase [Chloroflexota bacterium]
MPSRQRISRLRLLRFLDKLESGGAPAVSLYLPAGLAEPEIEEAISHRGGIPLDIVGLVAGSATGAVLFWGQQDRYLVLPPFPVEEKQDFNDCTVRPLRSLLQQELLIALILVRLGDYAIGVFRGEGLVSSKVGTGLVHSRHKKGGSSQRRFERHREKQMEYFFDRVSGHVREHLEPHMRQLDYVIYGGERHTLLAFRKQCRFLKAFDDRTLGRQLNVRKPRQQILEAAMGEVWSSELIEWIESKREW